MCLSVSCVRSVFHAANGNLWPLNHGDCCEQQSTTLETLSLPAGSDVVNAVVMASPGANTVDATVQGKLRSPGVLRYGHMSSAGLNALNSAGATKPVTASIALLAPTDVAVVCWKLGQGSDFAQRVAITVLQVE
jgi:hypothetical protein